MLESVLSFCCEGPRDWIQVLSFGGNYLYPLSLSVSLNKPLKDFSYDSDFSLAHINLLPLTEQLLILLNIWYVSKSIS